MTNECNLESRPMKLDFNRNTIWIKLNEQYETVVLCVVLNTTMNTVHVHKITLAHINRQFLNSNSKRNNTRQEKKPQMYSALSFLLMTIMCMFLCGRPLPIKGYKVIIALFITSVPLKRKFLSLIFKKKRSSKHTQSV